MSVLKFAVLVFSFSLSVSNAAPLAISDTATRLDIPTFTPFDIISGREEFDYDEYFLIDETQNESQLNLLDLVHVKKKFPLPGVPYDRRQQFGTWIDPISDDSCMNVRGLVLVRDADGPISVSPNGCAVLDGVWYDPYSGQNFESPTDIQIDHFVPLKNAYMTGAHEWSQQKRCLYANYLGNDFHLKAVSGKENMSKSDASPARYIPSNKSYVCEYLKEWLQIKVIWSLRLTPPEVGAIERIALQEKCDKQDFQMPLRQLVQQREYMEANANFCAKADPVASQP